MSIEKNPDKLSPIDLKLGITMRECAICKFKFHVLPKRQTNFRKGKEQEQQEKNDICLSCVMEGK